jgi:hypothetical protein
MMNTIVYFFADLQNEREADKINLTNASDTTHRGRQPL